MDGGGGMGQGTSTNFWSTGNDGVRVTVVQAESGTSVGSIVDFANRAQPATVLHFGKNNKIQYRNGTALVLQSGAAYNCIQPAYSMPPIITSRSRPAENVNTKPCPNFTSSNCSSPTNIEQILSIAISSESSNVMIAIFPNQSPAGLRNSILGQPLGNFFSV